jgi:transcriptional regulator with XRE-family HTH domain
VPVDGPDEGRITGGVLRAIRTRLGLTQERLADLLGIDPTSLKGWETGRRSLTSMPARRRVSLERALRSLGTSADELALLNTAMTADWLLGHLLDQPDHAEHPLATWVTTRNLSRLLAWPFLGEAPRPIRSCRPPALSSTERQAVFAGLREVAERSLASPDPDAATETLLRRNGYYAVAWDPSTTDWLDWMQQREERRPRARGWSPAWVGERSRAVARSFRGDREPLRRLIANMDDERETANLNYWAHYIGETRGDHISDDFMISSTASRWRRTELLRGLVASLTPATAHVDLVVHTTGALLDRRRAILIDDRDLTVELADRGSRLMDAPSALSAQSRRELDQVLSETRSAMTEGI